MAFPNVPIAPGVPALVRSTLSAVPDVIQLLTGDAPSLFAGLEPSQWGLFLNGAPVVTAESVLSFEFKKSYEIASFQVEKGAFESYDKVQRPFDVRLRFSTGADAAARQELLATTDAAVNSLDLVDAVTPLKTYQSINPKYYSYRQTAVNGVGLLTVDVFCEEVRVTGTSSFTNAQQVGNPTPAAASGTANGQPVSASIFNPISPSASPRVSDGTVQPVPAASGQFDLSQALP